jgi:hypothetical protein
MLSRLSMAQGMAKLLEAQKRGAGS